jgi:hypothetical protein
VVCIVFALFTQHRWEDYYITYRASRNLVEGKGLVYQPGARVHAFTSPAGVLLPALALQLAGGQSDTAALWIFRLWSIAAFTGAVTLLWQTTRTLGWTGFGSGLLVVLLLTDVKSVDFTINGMETAFLLLCLSAMLHTLVHGGPGTWWKLGLWAAGLMWARPDGFIFGGAVAIAWLLVLPTPQAAPHRRALLGVYGRAALLAAAGYLPWLVWAWHYYGSFVPHTVIAKGLNSPLPALADLPGLLARQTVLFPWYGGIRDTFLPAYVWLHGWPAWVMVYAIGVAWLCLLYWIYPKAGAAGRTASLAYFLCTLYGASVPAAPWYVPSYTLLANVTLAAIADDVWRAHPGRQLLRVPFVLHGAFAAGLLLATAWQLRLQQALIEDQRTKIGHYLRAHSETPQDSVFLEPLGYIGYFSQLKMLDFPGLCAPEVVAARRTVGDDWPALIRRLHPDWLVLRRSQTQAFQWSDPGLVRTEYRLTKSFDVSAKIAAVRFLPGRGYLEVDQTFDVYRRCLD